MYEAVTAPKLAALPDLDVADGSNILDQRCGNQLLVDPVRLACGHHRTPRSIVVTFHVVDFLLIDVIPRVAFVFGFVVGDVNDVMPTLLQNADETISLQRVFMYTYAIFSEAWSLVAPVDCAIEDVAQEFVFLARAVSNAAVHLRVVSNVSRHPCNCRFRAVRACSKVVCLLNPLTNAYLPR